MSSRAALIARAVSVGLLFAWLAAAGSPLLVMLALVLPFWIAMEIDARSVRPRLSAPFVGGGLMTLPSIGRRPSYPPTDHPKAA